MNRKSLSLRSLTPVPLFWLVFLSISAVSLILSIATGMLVKASMSSAFESYVSTLPDHMGMGGGMGRQVYLTAAEQKFLAGVDQTILVATLVGIGLAVGAAWLIARSITRPMARLNVAVKTLSAGDLGHRVTEAGALEIRQLGTAFNEMADSLQTSESLRRRMVSDVAHELRNPLAALRAQAEGMAEGVLIIDEARMGSIVDDVTRLSVLVNDLQEMATADAGHLRYQRKAIDLCELVRGETERVRPLLAVGVTLLVNCRAQHAVALIDGGRIEQVLRNLLMNSVRHTHSGSINVELTADDEEIRVAVRDTGDGIAAGSLAYVFERFYRSDVARSDSDGGSGLGLAISRRIAEDHGGSVFAESDGTTGATVGFVLPVFMG